MPKLQKLAVGSDLQACVIFGLSIDSIKNLQQIVSLHGLTCALQLFVHWLRKARDNVMADQLALQLIHIDPLDVR